MNKEPYERTRIIISEFDKADVIITSGLPDPVSSLPVDDYEGRMRF